MPDTCFDAADISNCVLTSRSFKTSSQKLGREHLSVATWEADETHLPKFSLHSLFGCNHG